MGKLSLLEVRGKRDVSICRLMLFDAAKSYIEKINTHTHTPGGADQIRERDLNCQINGKSVRERELYAERMDVPTDRNPVTIIVPHADFSPLPSTLPILNSFEKFPRSRS